MKTWRWGKNATGISVLLFSCDAPRQDFSYAFCTLSIILKNNLGNFHQNHYSLQIEISISVSSGLQECLPGEFPIKSQQMHNTITENVISITGAFNVYNTMCIILYCMYCLTAVLLQCLVSPLFLHTAPASKACKTHINLFLKLLVAEDLRWGGAPQWGHREILSNQNQSALLAFLMGNFSTALSFSLFRRKEDFFTRVNLKANLVLALLLSLGLQWAQWPTGSLCLYMQQVFSWCFQIKACTSLKREELQVVRRTILLRVLRGT